MSRTFVVSDIHGDLTGFSVIMEQFALAGMDLSKDRLVFLGDYVDGYGYSAQVVAQVRELVNLSANVVALRGNHEQLMIDAYEKSFYHPAFRLWYMQGGAATAVSYNMKPDVNDVQLKPTRRFMADVTWFETLPYRFEDETYHYVHAGFRPGVPLDQQNPHDMLWIRDEFINDTEGFGKPVVFGHTAIERAMWINGNKIAMDTRLRGSGHITGAILNHRTKDVDFVTSG